MARSLDGHTIPGVIDLWAIQPLTLPSRMLAASLIGVGKTQYSFSATQLLHRLAGVLYA